MKFKLVPEAPESLELVADAQRAVPLVPGSEDDCCARLMRRVGFDTRDVARTWLTFLRALELAEETASGFRRLRTDPTPDHLRTAFRERVFGAAEALATLEATDEPIDAAEAFDRFRERVPEWEHHKNPRTWEEVWEERHGRLLDWLVLLELAERTPDGYRAR